MDLVLISTEGERAIDVFHITKAGAKLTEAEEKFGVAINPNTAQIDFDRTSCIRSKKYTPKA